MSDQLIGGGWLQAASSSDAIFTVEQFEPDHEAMFDTARRFCDEQVWPLQAEIEAKKEGVMAGLMDQASELGLTMLDIPEAYDGLELPMPVSMRVLENTAREQSMMLSLMVQNGIGSLPVVLFGNEEQKQAWLPAFASGDKRGCYCLTEPGSGSDALAAASTAVLSDDGKQWILNGTKQFITNAGFADVGFVFAKVVGDVEGATGFSCFIVPLDTAGVTLGAEEDKLGIKGSSTRQVIMDKAQIPRANVLGQIGRGHVIAFNILNNGRYKLGGTALGSAKFAFDAALEYAQQRKQFGKQIADFGMIKRKTGQMVADIFAVESGIYRAVGDMDADSQSRGNDAAAKLASMQNYAMECSILKIAGSELLAGVADESLQMFGGYGFLEEYPAAKYVRDARIARIYEGTNEINRIVMPRTLLKKISSGEIELTVVEGDESITQMKNSFAVCFNAARSRYGDSKGFDRNQEVMANLADMMTAIYLAESATLRVAQMNSAKQVHADSVALVTLQSVAKVNQLAGELADHLQVEVPPASGSGDLLGLRQAIADAVNEEGRYAL
ncbi:MAG: acyl-CoA dehydrogenase [Gammaproteobacteria bacterium]|nr:MAG: acyl-CoA dehydrogenase [Gammaproteobacteria bacterium]RLA12879.1 MAG: acyl-CoA dehydrogenase [Gammaproteobacteria bacterium]